MSVAVAAVLDGMPEPADLRLVEADGHLVACVGARALCAFQPTDTGMRNMAVVMLTGLGFAGWRVAQVLGLTPEYVSMLRGRAREHGSAGLVRPRGRRPKLGPAELAQARRWHQAEVSNVEIAARLGVHDATVSRALNAKTGWVARLGAAGPEPDQADLDLGTGAELPNPAPEPNPAPAAEAGAQPEPAPEPVPEPNPEPEPAPGRVSDPAAALVSGVDLPAGGGWARIGTGSFACRYAGAALLHAFTDRVGATGVFASAAGAPTGRRRYDDVSVLAATATVFGLGFASIEAAKHPDRGQVGPVVGIAALPELRTLRPRLAALADGCDPLALQRSFAAAMLAADPNESGLYFVDEHFMPYAGKLPVGKGHNSKRRRAEPGRVDTTVCDANGRAVCFSIGEPSGLSKTLPGALGELRQILGPDAKVMLGFDRGGSYPAVFAAIRELNADWVTYRRAPLATPTALPVRALLRRGEKTIEVFYADQTVHLDGYGPCRQVTLFEHGVPVLQILTSDTHACAGALVWFLRARWRIENLYKYLDFYGIDYLADYHATIATNTKPVDNPERAAARKHLAGLHTQRDQLRADIGAAHTNRSLSIDALNRASGTAQRHIHKLDKQITQAEQALKAIPAKLPANQVNPNAQRAVHRAGRRALQMVLRLLAANAEHWLAHNLNAYLQDNHEYRATTRNLLHLAGTITYTPTSIHVRLDPPNTPRLARALHLLLDQINHTPPRIPGDPRPITYTITT